MMLYKDRHFEDMWTTIPFLTLEDNVFVKVKMVPGVIESLMNLRVEVMGR